MQKLVLVGAALVWLVGCSDEGGSSPGTGSEDPGQDDPGTKDPAGPGANAISHTFGPFDLEPGEDNSSLCESWTLGNEETLYVNAVHLTAKQGFHHSNWFHVPEEEYAGDDGSWPCEERGFSEPIAAAVGGVLFAQSTQALEETQQFPDGVVIPVPPRSKIVYNVHLLNAAAEPISTELTLALTPEPEEEVEVLLSGLSLQYEALALPPQASSAFTTECDVATPHLLQIGRALDFSIYHVLPHYHGLGRGLVLEATGGPDGDRVIFDGTSVAGEPLGQMIDPAFDMTGYQGLRMSCRYDNPSSETIGWGNGDGEMCVLLAFTDSERLWGGGVLGGSPGEPEMVDGVAQFEKSCLVISYPASHTE